MQLVDANAIMGQKCPVKCEVLADGKLCYKLFSTETGNESYPLSYGIEIECSLFGEKDVDILEDITVNYEYISELFELLVTYSVTPVSLRCIAEDFINEKYSFYAKII